MVSMRTNARSGAYVLIRGSISGREPIAQPGLLPPKGVGGTHHHDDEPRRRNDRTPRGRELLVPFVESAEYELAMRGHQEALC